MCVCGRCVCASRAPMFVLFVRPSPPSRLLSRRRCGRRARSTARRNPTSSCARHMFNQNLRSLPFFFTLHFTRLPTYRPPSRSAPDCSAQSRRTHRRAIFFFTPFTYCFFFFFLQLFSSSGSLPLRETCCERQQTTSVPRAGSTN